MEKTLAAAGRQMDTTAAAAHAVVVTSANAVVRAAQEVPGHAQRAGQNIMGRTFEHGTIAVLIAPAPCLLYGFAVGVVDTIRGR